MKAPNLLRARSNPFGPIPLLAFFAGNVLLIGFAIRVAAIWMPASEQQLNRRPIAFDADAWKAATLDDIYLDHNYWSRPNMVDDLLAHHNFVGWSEMQEENLIGQPVCNPAPWSPPRTYYPLGYTTDRVWLILHLDQHGSVMRFEKHID